MSPLDLLCKIFNFIMDPFGDVKTMHKYLDSRKDFWR